MEVNGLVRKILQNIFFCVWRRKKVKQVCNNMMVSKKLDELDELSPSLHSVWNKNVKNCENEV